MSILDDVEISRAYELRPGATYCVQVERVLSAEQFRIIQAHFDKLLKDTGCKFVLLEWPLRLVEPPSAPYATA